MKFQQQSSLSLSLLALASTCDAFVAPNSAGRHSIARPGSLFPRFVATSNTLLRATADMSSDTDSEVERLRSMAQQLREEAATLAAEQAVKVSEVTQRAFRKFDLNSDGTICSDELKIGLEKAFKNEIPDSRIEKLLAKFDKNMDGVLQMDEFVSVETFRNQLDALVREEKAIALEETKAAQQQEEIQKIRDMQLSIINDGEPTTSHLTIEGHQHFRI